MFTPQTLHKALNGWQRGDSAPDTLLAWQPIAALSDEAKNSALKHLVYRYITAELAVQRELATVGHTPAEHALLIDSLAKEHQTYIAGPMKSEDGVAVETTDPVSAALQHLADGLQKYAPHRYDVGIALHPDEVPKLAVLNEINFRLISRMNIPTFILDELANLKLLLSRASGGFDLEPEFARFCLDQLSPSQIADVYLQLAELHRYDMTPTSFYYYLDAGDMEAAATYADYIATHLYIEGEHDAILRVADALQGAHAPHIYLYRGIILSNRGQYTPALQAYVIAERQFGGDPVKKQQVQINRARIFLRLGKLDDVIHIVTPLIASEISTTRFQAFHTRGMSFIRAGEVDQALSDLLETLQIMDDHGHDDPLARSMVLQDLGVAYNAAGRDADEMRVLQEIVAIRRKLGKTSEIVHALNNLAYYYHCNGDYTSEQECIDEAFQYIHDEPNMNNRDVCYILWRKANLLRDTGQYVSARDVYGEALNLVGTKFPYIRCGLLLDMAILTRWQGDLVAAIGLAQQSLLIAQNSNFELKALLAKAELNYAQGRETIRVIEELKPFGEKYYLHLLPLVKLAFVNDQRPSTWQRLSAEIANGAISYTPPVSTILYQLVNRLQEFHMPPSGRDYLQIVLLGEPAFFYNTRRLVNTDWRRSNLAREIVYYLVLKRRTRRDSLLTTFWSDIAESDAADRLYTTLAHARHAVPDIIVFDAPYYQLNPMLAVDCDVYAFRSLIERAEKHTTKRRNAYDLWFRAYEIYKGELLPALDYEWVSRERQALSSQYFTVLLKLAESAFHHDDPGFSASVAREAIELEPYNEYPYELLFNALKRARQYSEIDYQFKLLTERLREIGETPSLDLKSYLPPDR